MMDIIVKMHHESCLQKGNQREGEVVAEPGSQNIKAHFSQVVALLEHKTRQS